MLEKIVTWFKNVQKKRQNDKCYSIMEAGDLATLGCCGGMVGGDESTKFIDPKCHECPYFVLFAEDRRNEGKNI